MYSNVSSRARARWFSVNFHVPTLRCVIVLSPTLPLVSAKLRKSNIKFKSVKIEWKKHDNTYLYIARSWQRSHLPLAVFLTLLNRFHHEAHRKCDEKSNNEILPDFVRQKMLLLFFSSFWLICVQLNKKSPHEDFAENEKGNVTQRLHRHLLMFVKAISIITSICKAFYSPKLNRNKKPTHHR